MNPMVIGGQLPPMRGQLAGNTASQTARAFDRLIGSLQERFGYSRRRAERELKRRMAKHHPRATARWRIGSL